MPTKDTSVKGIRLPDAMWQAIDRDAEIAAQTRNEWITKRLAWLLKHPLEVGKSDQNGTDTDEIEALE